ncbi:hypothetical protein LUZ60_004195 [Juncus effusus]|nr:hypothetical protein LUZ60_004195 [Juncus effusus]
MEMEMRAMNNIQISQDLTPPIPPLAFSLHSPFLTSHCSSCFRPLEPPNQSLSCPNCSNSINYCSPVCFASDSVLHSSSGECELFNHTKQMEISIDDSTDVRVALRLLHHLNMTGDLQFSNRIGGLLITDLDEVLEEEESELAEKIKDDATLMSSVRKPNGGAKLEMLVLWSVMRNSVEIQLSEFGPIGVGIYDIGFSWFNHSCIPNSSYRFELNNLSEKEKEFSLCEKDLGFLVVPSCSGDSSDVLEKGNYKKGATTQETNFGPRVIIRSIKPIKKGEQVCITYTDLLQPKDKRQLELWSKYRFICQCKRCSESPLNYIDYILTCDSKGLNSQDRTGTSASAASKYEYLYNEIQEAIEEYTSFNNLKLCCDKIERILSQNFLSLHPLHFLSLNSYITLSSAYKFRFKISEKNEFFNLDRYASAYSILLSFSTYNLFLFQPSLIASTSHFLLNTGETILSIFEQKLETSSSLKLKLNSSLDFESNTKQFVECAFSLLSKCWPFLVQNNLYLEKIKSPIDFSWIGFKMNRNNVLNASKIRCFACKFELNTIFEEERKCLYKLAIHCIIHGMYLANVCYGPRHYLIDKVKTLLYS